MSTALSVKPITQIVDGFRIPPRFSADAFRSAVQYKPRDDDVFIVTYPKCGTTWVSQLLILIIRQGVPLETHQESQSMCPFLEFSGAKAAEEMIRPGAIKVHLPYHLTPLSEKAKYIYVARNPKDTCVSYFHHVRIKRDHGFYGNFDEFFEAFISGETAFGDYFENLLGWYEHKNDPNVLFLTYEEMKSNIEEVIFKIASFLDDELYAEPLRQDPEKLRNVIEFSSFDYMKDYVGEALKPRNAPKQESINSGPSNKTKREAGDANFSKIDSPDDLNENHLVREGVVGGWRKYFTEDQSRRLDEKFFEKTKGTDIPNLWKDCM